jgi:hypothetical protein
MFSPFNADLISVEEIKDKQDTPFSLKRTLLFQPAIVAQRINAQQGWFSIHKCNMHKNTFTPFEMNGNYKTRLTKFTIPAKMFSDIRYDLDRFGINRATLFPDLDGLTSHIQWLKSTMSDEV